MGCSYHGLCALLLLLNEVKDCLPPTQQVSLEAVRIWTAFAHGEQPWEPYSKEGRFMRFGPEGRSSMCTFAEDHTRVNVDRKWLRENFEEVLRFARELILQLENDNARPDW